MAQSKQMARIIKARKRMLTQRMRLRFFAMLIMRLELVEAHYVETMATDGKAYGLIRPLLIRNPTKN
jgi:hypothetical protein